MSKNKIELSQLSLMEFLVLYVLRDSDFALNGYDIQKSLAHIFVLKIEQFLIHKNLKQPYDPKDTHRDSNYQKSKNDYKVLRKIKFNYSKDLETLKSDFEKFGGFLSTPDFYKMREFEKLMRKYFDFPTYSRILRILKVLEDESFVFERKIGDTKIVFSITNETRQEIDKFLDRIKLNLAEASGIDC